MDKTLREILDEVKAKGICRIKGVGNFYIAVQKGREGTSKLGGVEKAWKTDDKNVLKFYPSKSLDVSDFTVYEK